MSVVRPFSVLSKDEIGPESKTGRFLSKAEILGGPGVFSPLSKKDLLQSIALCKATSSNIDSPSRLEQGRGRTALPPKDSLRENLAGLGINFAGM